MVRNNLRNAASHTQQKDLFSFLKMQLGPASCGGEKLTIHCGTRHLVPQDGNLFKVEVRTTTRPRVISI